MSVAGPFLFFPATGLLLAKISKESLLYGSLFLSPSPQHQGIKEEAEALWTHKGSQAVVRQILIPTWAEQPSNC